MPADEATGASGTDRGQYLAALHDEWVTPLSVVTSAVGEVADAPVLEIRRIVAGEQNEVYDVSLGGAPSLIVRISHRGLDAHIREVWVLGQCALRGILAPRVHAHRDVEVKGEQRSVIIMERVRGTPLCDIDPDDLDVRVVLEELGAWLGEFHSIPVEGFGYVDGLGVGELATMDDWIVGLTAEAGVFEDAGRSVGLDASVIRAWRREILDSLRAVDQRVSLIHNDLEAAHVMVHEGHLSGVIDFGEVAAEPTVSDFAKWDFREGDRFPVEWIQAGYGDRSLFEPLHDRAYRALWLATGLWNMAWSHTSGLRTGVEASRDRLLGGIGATRSGL